ncbi:MAG TPA: hypothetical protein VKK06_14070 [Terriglobia bacterium]|nr:hypothetical protein [Terriglobia bacterium]
MRIRKGLFTAAIALTLIMTKLDVPQATAAQRVVVVRPYRVYRPVWGPTFYYPSWYYPYSYPYSYGWRQVYIAAPRTGTVKIQTRLKDAGIYVDGGFAGMTGKLKEFSLQPGNHDIEVRNASGQTLFHERVQVLLGKTVEVRL